jgi:DNA repair protein RecN (Recombination protein N)
LLRQGTQAGEVIAEFSIKPNSKVPLILEQSGITLTDTIIVRRNISSSDGRKRIFVNDRSISLDLLKSISKNLVELQGQNDNQSLLNEQSHANFLDAYADLDDCLIEMRKCWRTMQQAKKDHETAIANYNILKSDKDFLEQSMQEIVNFDVQLDEEVDLDQKRRSIKAIEKSKEKFEKIAKLISSEQIENNLSNVIKLLETTRQNVGDEVDLSISAIDRTLNEFAHAQEEVLKLLNGQNFNINELENIEERLFKLRALGRKYNVATDQLPALLQNMGKKIRNVKFQPREHK